MQDQVMALKQRGIRAEYISSAQTNPNVLRNAERGRYDILYLTPEKACGLTNSFWSRLLDSGICLFAVDEAHCISEWGHSFRVEYKQLGVLRNVLLNVPVVGLTATATEKVRDDIILSLKMRDPHITIGSFDRQNLFYSVKSIDHCNTFLDDLVMRISSYISSASSTIIYCTTVKDAIQIFESLEAGGIAAGLYHGKMSNEAREDSHRSFIRDDLYVMVATIAFGMGIDKPDIRYVIHYGCPKSLESYFQESGRCGRDGIPSTCMLYYMRRDFAKADFYCAEARTADQRKAILESYVAAQRYCLLTTCRRNFLLEYFGEKNSPINCGTCDNCTSSKKDCDMSREAFLLMGCIQSCGGQLGLNLPVDVLRGSRSRRILDAKYDNLPFHGLGKEFPSNWWKVLAYQLISRDYLIETFRDVYKTVRVGPKGMQFLNSCTPDYQPPLLLTLTTEMMGDEENKVAVSEAGVINFGTQLGLHKFSQVEDLLYRRLVEERLKYARDIGTAPYALCGDQTLRRIAVTRPSTRARLANIDGLNQHFLTTHGDILLQTILSLSKELSLPLDGEPHAETLVSRKVPIKPNNKRLTTPVRFQSWKMWQEDGFTLQKIASHPDRAAPIKEQTVLEHIFGAAREGCAVDWLRLCGEIELTHEIFKNIQDAVSKVGYQKLKPIKEELPEEVTYGQIRAVLVMQELGVSMDIISPGHQDKATTDEFSDGMSKLSDGSDHSCRMGGVQPNLEMLNPNVDDGCSVKKSQQIIPDLLVEGADVLEAASHIENSNCSRKRRKFDALGEAQNIATESSVLLWLDNFGDGVSLSDILERFNGSTEDSIIDILQHLAGEFLIFKKNNVYKVM
ncbi:Werner syndrome ATP-dependent helicase-like [Dorcoceras hygrometricum]|uniref:ATP-dependent DNA helicase n=1 Tax=Dorcoceras hygrometricum TaxID=472368 RepID=A0A2Z7AGV2_9LAMI|nr:Werner syndrome ATP-dependent helicase-like [Dorcoceras hygrometricum]